jgi:hypothetical protein
MMRTFVVAIAVFGWTCLTAAEEKLPMPSLLGKTLDEARAIAKAAGFAYAIETRPRWVLASTIRSSSG